MHDHSITEEQDEALLLDLYDGQRDVVELVQAHGLRLRALLAWLHDEQTLTAIDAMRTIDDIRSQNRVSRYRPSSITRLVEFAIDEKSPASPETVRRACTDVLRGDLKSLEKRLAPRVGAGEAQQSAINMRQLREALYSDGDDGAEQGDRFAAFAEYGDFEPGAPDGHADPARESEGR